MEICIIQLRTWIQFFFFFPEGEQGYFASSMYDASIITWETLSARNSSKSLHVVILKTITLGDTEWQVQKHA